PRAALARVARPPITLLLITALALGCSDEASTPTASDASDGAESGSATTPEPETSTNAADRAAGSARESASAAPGPILDCVAMGVARPICKFQSPEDIVALPGDEALLISGYGAMGADGQIRKSGGLYLFRLADESVETLYTGGTSADVAEAGWGDPTCPAPPAERFNAHGIDLVRRDDGRLALLVVQHFGREAIELFEVTGAGTDRKSTRL